MAHPHPSRRSPVLPLLVAPLLVVAAAAGCAPADPTPALDDGGEQPAIALQEQQSGTTALLQAVSAVDDQVVWVSGHLGTWVRTLDGGSTWTAGTVPGADSLQFRDVHAVSADTAILMSAGSGDLSRIYLTTDGGQSWELLHTNPDSAGFYDCMDFWDSTNGVLFGDTVDGKLVVRLTSDGGRGWRAPASLPEAQDGEGGFAASGGCVVTARGPAGNVAWVATGNGDSPRLLRSLDGGESWEAAPLPLVAGDAAGATAVTFRDASVGVVVGGDIGKRDVSGARVATSSDGGATWREGGAPTFAGAVYGAAYAPDGTAGAAGAALVIVGPGGADISRDDGATWQSLDGESYWSVGFAPSGAGWLVGPGGRIVKIGV